MKKGKLGNLVQKIVTEHIHHDSNFSEVILLGYCDNETVSVHLSRYLLASRLIKGAVLDCASGSCYGSNILRRNSGVKWVVSVDIDRSLLKYGKLVYNADCVCADTMHLPFREQCFDSIISLETLEHVKNEKEFLVNIISCLNQRGELILSTPNKLYTSPFIPKPLNPYHMKEYYLATLIILLKSQGLKVVRIYGGSRVKSLELIRRIIGSFAKFFLDKLSVKTHLIDNLYNSISKFIITQKTKTLIDPDPSLYTHERLKTGSNIVTYKYFLIYAHKSG